MSLNENALIVPLTVANEILDRVPAASTAETLTGYWRVQLLTEAGYHELVFEGHDRSYIVYGSLSRDFPLCLDFADICANDVKREAIRRGLAVRPCFGVLIYTKKTGARHAINYAITADNRVLFFEPQTDKWLKEPEDVLTLDEFRI